MKKTILFLPGMMSDARLWQPQISALENAYDIRVFYDAQLSNLEDVAKACVKNLPPNFAVCGTSMGGYLALAIAQLCPDRVTHLGLFNTNAHEDAPERSQARRAEIADGPDLFASRRQNDDYFQVFLSPKNQHRSDIIATLQAMNIDLGFSCFVNQQTACISRKNWLKQLHLLKMPVTVVGGHDDVVTPMAGQIDMLQQIPHAKLVIIEKCGHIASLERPDVVTHEISELLGR